MSVLTSSIMMQLPVLIFVGMTAAFGVALLVTSVTDARHHD